MTDSTSWLPELITLADCGGDWPGYLETIYAIFCRDFVESAPASGRTSGDGAHVSSFR